MSSIFEGSTYRQSHDLEAGSSCSALSHNENDKLSPDPFDITSTKNASTERLRRWRQAALVLNASRRFRYTLDLNKKEEKWQLLGKIRAQAQAIRAACLFEANGDGENSPSHATSMLLVVI